MSTQYDWHPLSIEKISLSLSHLVPEILRPKVGLFFTKMYYLTDFKHFVSIFSLICNPIDLLFHWFYIFLTSHICKTLDPIGSKFFRMLNPATENLVKYPPRVERLPSAIENDKLSTVSAIMHTATVILWTGKANIRTDDCNNVTWHSKSSWSLEIFFIPEGCSVVCPHI